HLIDLGPGAGRLGGEVVYEGPPPGVHELPQGKFAIRNAADCDRSPTVRALSHPILHPTRGKRRPVPPDHPFALVGDCRANNLKGIDAAVPLGRLTVLTGISGSGKSTLMHSCIAAAARDAGDRKRTARSRPWGRATGFGP